MKNWRKLTIVLSVLVFVSVITGLLVTGWQIGWGPFRFLFKGFEEEIVGIEERYDYEKQKGEIVFYGASNFRLWADMEEDLSDYKVQNHGFGGSTDELLMQYADRVLYPYEPKIVFFQTGSNDYVNRVGTDKEKIKACMDYKKEMFETFHEKLPNAKFVVMSGLLLPGRSQYTEMTQEINRQLKELCQNTEYMYFVDAEEMTFDGKEYKEELFRKDKIHLNHDGQLLWCNNYIKPMLEKIIVQYDLNELRNN